MWRARLFGKVFALHVSERIFLEWNAGVTALLRTVVDEAVFADVEIARPRAASPLIGLAIGQLVLEIRDPDRKSTRLNSSH